MNCPMAVQKRAFLDLLISASGINPIIIKLPNGMTILSGNVTIICFANTERASTLYFKRHATAEDIEVGK